MSGINALRLAAEDNVAVALADLAAGDAARFRAGDGLATVTAAGAVPLGHKLALRALLAGEGVVKYGVVIASARRAIAAGEHVHVHNIASNRARAGA
jgi:hypothetical protein